MGWLGTAPTEGRVARPDGGGAAAAVPPQDEVNQEDSEQNEVDGMKKGARVTRDEERVLPVDWTEIRLCR